MRKVNVVFVGFDYISQVANLLNYELDKCVNIVAMSNKKKFKGKNFK